LLTRLWKMRLFDPVPLNFPDFNGFCTYFYISTTLLGRLLCTAYCMVYCMYRNQWFSLRSHGAPSYTGCARLVNFPSGFFSVNTFKIIMISYHNNHIHIVWNLNKSMRCDHGKFRLILYFICCTPHKYYFHTDRCRRVT
jgi:hypothetical protein